MSFKSIFFDKIDLRLFYFHVTIWYFENMTFLIFGILKRLNITCIPVEIIHNSVGKNYSTHFMSKLPLNTQKNNFSEVFRGQKMEHWREVR